MDTRRNYLQKSRLSSEWKDAKKSTIVLKPYNIDRRKQRVGRIQPEKKKSFFSARFFINCLINCVCLAGCLFQCWSLSAPSEGGYFAYDVVTSVTVAYPEKVKYPMKTFCFYTFDVIKWDKLMEQPIIPSSEDASENARAEFELYKNKTKVNHFEKVASDSLFKKYFSARALLNITYDPDEVFNNCMFVFSNNYTLSQEACNTRYHITKYLHKYTTCYSMNTIADSEYDLSLLRLVYMLQPGVASLSEMKSNFSSLYLYIHDPIELPTVQNPRAIRSPEEESDVLVTYNKYETFLMKSPYPTNCRSYEEYGTKANCINECLTSMTISSMKYNSLFVPVLKTPPLRRDDKYLDLRVISDEQVVKEESLFAQSSKINRICNKLCAQPQCNDHIYSPTLLATVASKFNLFVFFLPFTPDMIATSVEKMGISSYLSNVVSALGFWLGISFLSTLEYTIKIISHTGVALREYIFQKYR